jgi:hypothetical protein
MAYENYKSKKLSLTKRPISNRPKVKQFSDNAAPYNLVLAQRPYGDGDGGIPIRFQQFTLPRHSRRPGTGTAMHHQSSRVSSWKRMLLEWQSCNFSVLPTKNHL